MKKNISLKEITNHLREKERKLIPPKDTNNPLATSGTSCNESVIRGMKQLYLAYITEVASSHPDIVDGSDLIQNGTLQTIPSLLTQDGWDIAR